MPQDLYTKWLNIPPGERPPDHYTLLGVDASCDDQEALEEAAQAQLTRLDQYSLHPDPQIREACQGMMNEVARARMALAARREPPPPQQRVEPSTKSPPLPTRAMATSGSAQREVEVSTQSRAPIPTMATSPPPQQDVGASTRSPAVRPSRSSGPMPYITVIAIVLSVTAVVSYRLISRHTAARRVEKRDMPATAIRVAPPRIASKSIVLAGAAPTLIRTFNPHVGALLRIDPIEGGRKLVVSGSQKFAIFDAATGDQITPVIEAVSGLPQINQHMFASVSAQGRVLLSLGDQGENLRLWDLQTLSQIGPTIHHEVMFNAEISPDGATIAGVHFDLHGKTSQERVILWNAADGKPTGIEINHGQRTECLSFSPDSKWIVTGSRKPIAQVWDVATGAAVSPPVQHSRLQMVMCAIFNPRGDRVASADWGGRLLIWEPTTGKIERTIDLMTDGRALGYSPDGERIAAGGMVLHHPINAWSTASQVFDVATAAPITGLLPHEPAASHNGPVHGMVFSADGRYLLSHSAYDKSARIWDLNNAGAIVTFETADRSYVCAGVFTGADQFITANVSGSLRIWKLPPESHPNR